MSHLRALSALVTAAVLLALTGCVGAQAPVPDTERAPGGGVLATYGLTGLDAREIVERLEATPVAERPDGLVASVRPDVLVLADGADELELPMPEDAFYLSVAPYVDATHDCFFHSLTTCLGELGGERVDVEVVGADGEVLHSARETVNDNGFLGLWLPRGADATLTVSYAGRTASLPVSTGPEDPTCLTTAQLV